MGVWCNYMCIRVSMDVRKPLKRRMKLKKAGGDWILVDFKYERLNIFCLTCGLLGHTARQCPKLYNCPKGEIVPVYGHWLKVPTRRNVINSGERSLLQGPLETVETGKGKSKDQVVAMSVDSVNPTISGVTLLKPIIDGADAGNLALNLGADNKLSYGKQFKEKSKIKTIVVVDEDMEGEEILETGLIVNDLKRRRFVTGLHITIGLGEEAKNGPAVGPVSQAHRAQ